MSTITSIHDILDKEGWNLNEINTFLEQDASSINKVDCSGTYPLLRVLADERCSVDMVKLFLQYGADINLIMSSCLNTSFYFMCNRGQEICRIFWGKVIESDLYRTYFDGRSPLCVFLNTDMKPDIIKQVLNTDNSLNACKEHVSSLHCAMMHPNTKFKKEMCQILIEAGQVFNMYIVGEEGQSFLCYAFSQGAGEDIIKLFLKAGCPLNNCRKHISALHCAMYSPNLKSKENIYAILIEAGLASYMHYLDSDGQSFLCNAMSLGTEPGAIKLLLAKGCRVGTCKKHASELHCVTRLRESKYKVEVCQLLIEAFAGSDLDKLDLYGQTPICNALQHGAEPEVFTLLLNAGCSLTACRMHSGHPLFCATMHSGVLRADTLQLVINAYPPLMDPTVGHSNYLQECALRCALKNCIYETEAIKILHNYHHEWLETNETVLHVAVKNRQCCKPSVVKFLIDQGYYVCRLDDDDKNSLELAIKNNCHPDVIEVLVKNLNMDCCQNRGKTSPMQLAVHEGKDAYYLEVMLKAGALLTSSNDPEGSEIVLSALIKYYLNQCPERIDVCKLLVKYIYLENSKFKISSLTCGRKCYKVISDFAKDCVREKEIMESHNIRSGYSLYELIRVCSATERNETQHKRGRKKCKANANIYKENELDQLLKVLADNGCYLYSDVISEKICRVVLKEKLTKLFIYTPRSGSDLASTAMRVVLNRECVSKIEEFLSQDELLRLILAFYDPNKQTPAKNSAKEKKCAKSKSEQPARRGRRKRRRV